MTANWRSLMFVPAHDQRRLEKAHLRGADALILDLEDGVGEADKARARAGLPAAIDGLVGHSAEVLVRINVAWRPAMADLDAAVRPGLAAVMVPKVEDAGRLATLAAMIGEFEAERGLPVGGIGLLPLLESAPALDNLTAIADAERVVGLALGVEDFALSLGVAPGPECLDLPCRMIALACSSRSIAGLAAPVSITAFDQPEAFAAAVARARAMGLAGTLCVHPAQVAAVNEAFAPTQADIDEAHQILHAWAEGQGAGVIRVGGRMIDIPVVRRAERLIARLG